MAILEKKESKAPAPKEGEEPPVVSLQSATTEVGITTPPADAAGYYGDHVRTDWRHNYVRWKVYPTITDPAKRVPSPEVTSLCTTELKTMRAAYDLTVT